MTIVAQHIIFSGHVQGVGFRYTALRIAGRYNITGFVKNLPNGTVEMLAQGPQPDVEGCINDIKDYFSGYLRDCRINDIPVDPRYRGFEIAY